MIRVMFVVARRRKQGFVLSLGQRVSQISGYKASDASRGSSVVVK